MPARTEIRPLIDRCDRRGFLDRCAIAAGAAAFADAFAIPQLSAMQKAVIPSSRESIPRVGLGTWQTFDVGGNAAKREVLAETLRVFLDAGGKVIDTSPMYGTSEQVLGDLLDRGKLRDRAWLATKVWTKGEEEGVDQMTQSLRFLHTKRVELLQVHNLVDWRTHLRTLRAWKDAGRVKYIGVTHYEQSALEAVSQVLRSEPLDFVQLNLSLDEPQAAERMLGLCEQKGVAFIANRPFGGGASFTRVRAKPLPPWCSEYDIASWAQYMLKWILSHPQVTAAIPGTGNPVHMADNVRGAMGRMPDARGRARLAAHWSAA